MNEFKNYCSNIKIAYNIKFLINDYINNEIKILKYKYIFEDSINFKFDENLEKIISVRINFFKEKRFAKDFYSNNDIKKMNNNLKKKKII